MKDQGVPCLVAAALVLLVILALAYHHFYGGSCATSVAYADASRAQKAYAELKRACAGGPPYPPGQNCCHVRDTRFPHYGNYDVTHFPPLKDTACPYDSPCPPGQTCHLDPERIFGYCE
jgi:hypothetical protein